MDKLGRDMQAITGAISKEEWAVVAELAPKIANHAEPPVAEKMRILAWLGTDAGKFRSHDGQTHESATAMGDAAKRGDGLAVISAFRRYNKAASVVIRASVSRSWSIFMKTDDLTCTGQCTKPSQWPARALTSLALVGLLAGCAVGPDFKRPEAPTTSNYTVATMPAQTASAAILLGRCKPSGSVGRSVWNGGTAWGHTDSMH
jgi:hypothetical protein